MKKLKLCFLCFLLIASFEKIQAQNGNVSVVGAMKNVMRKGELFGTITLDTISNKKNLYGIGPVAYLKGEILVIDGQSYVSTINGEGKIVMQETYQVQAPFFVYANNDSWTKVKIPKHIRTMSEIETFIDEVTKNQTRPFVFKLMGTFEFINFHIQNLPDGTIVRSPEDAHQRQGKFERKNVKGSIVGFFSTTHQAIFTHHDTFMHLHFLNEEKTEMGHVDNISIHKRREVYLWIPKN